MTTMTVDHSAVCESYQPGHRLHWSLYKMASAAATVPVTNIAVHGTTLEITVVGQDEPIRWQHHDPKRLMFALEHATDPILAAPSYRALRIDGYWFNCAQLDADLFDCC